MTSEYKSIVTQRMDRLPITSLHIRQMVILVIAFFFDEADTNTFSNAAPALIKYWHMSVAAVSQIIGSGFLGMFCGAILGGWIGDLIGRRKTLMWSLGLYSIASFANAFAHSVDQFLVIRLVTGFFLGVMTVMVMTFASEFFPKMTRGKYQALVMAIGICAVPLFAFYARWVVALGPDGWRWIFIGGAVGIVGWILSFFWLSETPRWYASKGFLDKAEQIVSQMEREANLPPVDHTDIAVQPLWNQPTKTTVGELFKKGQSGTTILLTIVWIFVLSAFWGFQAWVPTLLSTLGMKVTKSLLFSGVMMIGMPLGGLAAMPLSDRFGRKLNLVVALGLGIILGVGLGFSRASWLILTVGFLLSFVLQNQWPNLYAYTAENFPTHVRSAGSGLCSGIGRLGTSISPIIVGYILTRFGYIPVFVFFSSLYLIALLSLLIWGRQTKGLSLEQITEVQVPA